MTTPARSSTGQCSQAAAGQTAQLAGPHHARRHPGQHGDRQLGPDGQDQDDEAAGGRAPVVASAMTPPTAMPLFTPQGYRPGR